MEGVFVAGDGDLAVVYQAGAHVWGSWNVNYSEGVEPEDFEADRSLGYVGDTGDAGDELAARMWIRADVSIDQDSQSSTLPAVFRDAHGRMSGDVVVERTISGLGLGGLVPYVDFHHGDEIGTVIGPKVVPLPVNGIEFSTDPDGGQDYEVHVGKGLLGNREERDLRNAQLEAQIFKEIAERKREQARLEEQQERDRQLAKQAQEAADKADSAASTANSAASAAQSTATTAKDLAEKLEDLVDVLKYSVVVVPITFRNLANYIARESPQGQDDSYYKNLDAAARLGTQALNKWSRLGGDTSTIW